MKSKPKRRHKWVQGVNEYLVIVNRCSVCGTETWYSQGWLKFRPRHGKTENRLLMPECKGKP